jgi:D-alanyl-D-alanine carboxypeptidase/D-alanyl-D-alanine-endopeptidase (penicillin-binding protein 4)
MRPSKRQGSGVRGQRSGAGVCRSSAFVAALCGILVLPGATLLSTATGASAAEQAPGGALLVQQIDALLADPALRGAAVGCRVIDCATGAVLYAANADAPLIPASNLKLATTAAALDTLGPDFRYVTRLGLVGKDLVVIGAGDPNISGRFFEGDITAVFTAWARELVGRKITAIEGDLVADDTLFDRQYVHPDWPAEQLTSWYCAPVGALSLNDNCLDVTVRPGGAVGQAALADFAPRTGLYQLVNAAVTVSAGERLAVDYRRQAGARDIVVRGRVPVGSRPFTDHVTVDDPGLFFISALREVLAEHGIAVQGGLRLAETSTNPKDFVLLATCSSSLSATAKVTNTRSQNFYAEGLLKLLGAKATGQGTFATGAAAVERFLAQAKVGAADYHIADGSGLAKTNRLSAAHLTNLLRYMAGRPAGAVYRESLPTAGEDGGLARRLAEAPYRGRVHAKTGTLSGVTALSGYVDTLGGRTLAFSILINHPRGYARPIEDGLCRLLVRAGA